MLYEGTRVIYETADERFYRVRRFIWTEKRMIRGRASCRGLEAADAAWVSDHITKGTEIGRRLETLFASWGITRTGKGCHWSEPTNLPVEDPDVTDAKQVTTPKDTYAIGDVLEITTDWPPVFRPLVGRRAVIRSGEESPDALGFSAVVVVLEDDGITETTHTFAVTTIPGEPAPLIYCPNGWKVVDRLQPVTTWVRPRSLMDDWNDVRTFVGNVVAGLCIPDADEEQRVIASLNRLKPTN